MPLKTYHDDQPTLDLTPMIDVVFLLIIFFMVGTKFSELERNIDLQVPEVSDQGALSDGPQRRLINVYRDGEVTLDRRPITLDELTSQLTLAHDQYNDLGVVVRGDAASRFQNVAEVLNACKQAGVSEMAISVKLTDPLRR